MQLHWLLLIVLAVVIILPTLLGLKKNNTSLEQRKQQSSNLLRENVLKRKIEQITEKRVRFSKRESIETLCLQAGLPISFAEYVMVSLVSSLVVGLMLGFMMNNVLLGLVFIVIGYMLPKQFIGMMKNRRIAVMDKQIGSFMSMTLMRYETTRDFGKALELSQAEFIGEEPLYTELRRTVLDINLGKPVSEAMDGLALRTANKYMQRLSDYYKIASAIGTDEIRKKLLNQAYLQFEENRVAKQTMKKELATVVREAYIMLASIPMFAVYQVLTNKNYISFMTGTFLGKVGTVAIVTVFMGAIWYINKFISAPLDNDKK
jgi:tight adherence protein B